MDHPTLRDRPGTIELVVENVRLVEAGRDTGPAVDLAIRDGRIAQVAPAGTLRGSPRARSLDGGGGLCLPGLVNTHNHSPLMIVRGVVEDLGFAPAYTPGVPQGHWLSEEETFLLSRLGLLELVRAGCTTVVDYYRCPSALARAAHESGLRAVLGGRIMDASPQALADGRLEADPALGDSTLAESLALIERWDGADDGRIRCMHAPHAPDTCSRPLLERVASLAAADGRPVHTHLAQSPLEVEAVRRRDGMSPTTLLDACGLLGPDLFAAHCIFMDDDDVRRFGAASAVVCHAPLGNAASGRIAPIEALRDAGARITLCTDTKSADLFESMRMAIAGARIRAGGRFALDAPTVLDWATRGGALLGTARSGALLAEGSPADLVVLEAQAPNLAPGIDPVGTVVHGAHAGNVRHVVCAGRCLVEDHRATHVDGDEIVREARRVAEGLWRRARGG